MGKSRGSPTTVSQHVARLLDHFVHEGPNGRHQCLVGQILGPNVSSASTGELLYEFWDNGRLPAGMAHRLCGQLALAVAYLHKRDVAHGDLHPGNVLLCLPRLCTTAEDIYDLFDEGKPYKHRIHIGNLEGPRAPPSPHRPDYLLSGLGGVLDLLCDCLREPNIVLCDFSESYIPSLLEPPRLRTPHFCRPPEALLAFAPHATQALDMWALGVLFYYFMSGRALFQGRNGDDGQLTEMVLKLGPFLEPIWSKWEKRAEFFDELGKPLNPGWGRTLLLAVDHALPPGSERRRAFELLLRSMVYYDTAERACASRVLESVWFKDHCRLFMNPGDKYQVEYIDEGESEDIIYENSESSGESE